MFRHLKSKMDSLSINTTCGYIIRMNMKEELYNYSRGTMNLEFRKRDLNSINLKTNIVREQHNLNQYTRS